MELRGQFREIVSDVLATLVGIILPFWFIWTVLGFGQKYFSFLPIQYYRIPYWDFVALYLIVSFLRFVFFRTPVLSGPN